MCHFISWIEKPNGDVLFLTYKDIYKTKRGKELQEHCKNSYDLVGHGAIRFYFNYQGGIERECEDFSDPSNFPKQIVSSIKRGKFRGMATPEMLLSKASLKIYKNSVQLAKDAYKNALNNAWAAYENAMNNAQDAYDNATKEPRAAYENAVKEPRAAYENAVNNAQDAYEKAMNNAWAAYENAVNNAQDAYEKAMKCPYAAYKKAVQSANDAYQKAVKEPRAAYENAVNNAQDAYDKAVQPVFWNLFRVCKNRNPKWR